MTTRTVCTWNAGDNGTADNLRNLMSRYDGISLQEMGDRDGLYDAAHNYGWKSYDGDGQDGKRSTPLIWNPKRLEWKEGYAVKLSDAQTVNPGTGPEKIKTKWAIGGRFHVDGYGDAFRMVSCHLVADSSSGERNDLARKQINRLADLWPDADGACVIAGDLNTGWNTDLVKPLKSDGWKSCHAYEYGPYPTHGDWTPDHIWTRNAKITACGTIGNKSDHDALWATYDLK